MVRITITARRSPRPMPAPIPVAVASAAWSARAALRRGLADVVFPNARRPRTAGMGLASAKPRQSGHRQRRAIVCEYAIVGTITRRKQECVGRPPHLIDTVRTKGAIPRTSARVRWTFASVRGRWWSPATDKKGAMRRQKRWAKRSPRRGLPSVELDKASGQKRVSVSD